MRTPLLLGAVAALLAPTAPRAEVPVELGARVGFAAAFGDAAGQVRMKEASIASQVPFQLDASVRPRPDLAVGVYASYGPGQVNGAALSGACALPGVSCSGHAWRAGLQGRYVLSSVQSPVVPWVGAAVGWEWASVEGRDAAGSSRVELGGLDGALQAGGELRVGERLALGPYLQLGAGRYLRADARGSAAPAGGALADRTFHGWLGVGVAATLRL